MSNNLPAPIDPADHAGFPLIVLIEDGVVPGADPHTLAENLARSCRSWGTTYPGRADRLFWLNAEKQPGHHHQGC